VIAASVVLAVVGFVAIVGLLIAVTRNGSSGSDSSAGLLDVQVQTPVTYYRDDQLARLRVALAQGCPNCKAETGVTRATSLDKVAVAVTKKCFYCGFDFAGLSAEASESEDRQSSLDG